MIKATGVRGGSFVIRSFALKKKDQSGFLMPLAIFIVIGLGALALAISRLTATGTSSVVLETLSVQSLYAAEAAAEVAFNKVLFDVATPGAADANCNSVDGSSVSFSAQGMNLCQANITCVKQSGSGNAVRVYLVSSFAQCGAGNLVAARRVEAAAVF